VSARAFGGNIVASVTAKIAPKAEFSELGEQDVKFDPAVWSCSMSDNIALAVNVALTGLKILKPNHIQSHRRGSV
jgi:hypothetical protein